MRFLVIINLFLLNLIIKCNGRSVSVTQTSDIKILQIDGQLSCDNMECPKRTAKCIVSKDTTADLRHIQRWKRCVASNGKILKEDKTTTVNHNKLGDHIHEYVEADVTNGGVIQTSGKSQQDIDRIINEMHAKHNPNKSVKYFLNSEPYDFSDFENFPHESKKHKKKPIIEDCDSEIENSDEYEDDKSESTEDSSVVYDYGNIGKKNPKKNPKENPKKEKKSKINYEYSDENAESSYRSISEYVGSSSEEDLSDADSKENDLKSDSNNLFDLFNGKTPMQINLLDQILSNLSKNPNLNINIQSLNKNPNPNLNINVQSQNMNPNPNLNINVQSQNKNPNPNPNPNQNQNLPNKKPNPNQNPYLPNQNQITTEDPHKNHNHSQNHIPKHKPKVQNLKQNNNNKKNLPNKNPNPNQNKNQITTENPHKYHNHSQNQTPKQNPNLQVPKQNPNVQSPNVQNQNQNQIQNKDPHKNHNLNQNQTQEPNKITKTNIQIQNPGPSILDQNIDNGQNAQNGPPNINYQSYYDPNNFGYIPQYYPAFNIQQETNQINKNTQTMIDNVQKFQQQLQENIWKSLHESFRSAGIY